MTLGIVRSNKLWLVVGLVAVAVVAGLAAKREPRADPRQTSTAGSDIVAVPSVIGVPLESARTVLSLQRLEGTVVGSEETCGQPAGAVVSQSPAGMTQAAAGSEVGLVLAERTPLPVPEGGFNEGGSNAAVLEPGNDHAASGRDGAPTRVSFTLVGEACATGTVVVSHPTAGREVYELQTGEEGDRTLVYGPGEITIRFDSLYAGSRLVVEND